MSQPSILDMLETSQSPENFEVRNRSGGDMTTTTRQKLRPWLEGLLHRGDIEGVEWLNLQDKTFKIPWKHGGKSDWEPEDGELFKAWAKNTGKYREGQDKEEYAKWKTRVRCALHKANDIQEIKDLHRTEEPRPFRVYKFLPQKESRRGDIPNIGLTDEELTEYGGLMGNDDSYLTDLPAGVPIVVSNHTASYSGSAQPPAPTADESMDVDDSSQVEEGRFPSDLMGFSSSELLHWDPNDPSDLLRMSLSMANIDMDVMDYQEAPPPMPSYDQIATDPNSFPTDPTTGEPNFTVLTPDDSMSQPIPSTSGASQQELVHLKLTDDQGNVSYVQCSSDEVQHFRSILRSATIQVLPPAETATLQQLADEQYKRVSLDHQYIHMDAPPPVLLDLDKYQCQGHELRVSLFYFGKCIMELDLMDPQGYRFYYGYDSDIRTNMSDKKVADFLLGPEEMIAYHFPPIPEDVNPLQRQNLGVVLEGLEKGFTVLCRDGCIYVTRYCKTRVFVSSYEENEVKDSLPRRMTQEKFNYHKYQGQLRTQSFTVPNPTLYIGLAQKWNYGKCNGQLAMSMKITCCKAQQLRNTIKVYDDTVFYSGGDSFRTPQISKSDSYDRQVNAIKQQIRPNQQTTFNQ